MNNISVEDIEKMPSGRVLLRDGKKKLRVVKPAKLNKCEICFNGILNNTCKWESGGNVTILTLCPACALEEIK